MNASTPAVTYVALPASRTDHLTLAQLRAALTALTFPSPHLTDAEKLRANHHIHTCPSPTRLTRWLHTIPQELTRRALAA